PAALHSVRLEVAAMHRVGLEQEVIERRLIEGLSLLAGPVMAQRAIGRLAGSAWLRRPQFHHVQNLLVGPTCAVSAPPMFAPARGSAARSNGGHAARVGAGTSAPPVRGGSAGGAV